MSDFKSTFVFIIFLFSYTYSSPVINSAVKNVVQSVDESAQPCEDFYQYACGNWIKSHPMPPNEPQWGTFIAIGQTMKQINKDIVQQPAQKYDTKSLKASKTTYIDCMKEASKDTTILQEIIRGIGGWPLLNSSWNENDFDWWEFIGRTKNSFGLSLLLKTDVKFDFTIPEKSSNAIYLDQANLFVTAELLMQHNVELKTIEAYHKLIKTVAKHLDGSNTQISHLDKKIEDIIEFEMNVANIMTKEEDRYFSVLISTIGHVDFIYKYVMKGSHVKVEFKKYLDKVFSTSGATLSSTDKLIVIEKHYLYKLLLLISITPKETVANYLVWRVIGVLAFYSNDALSKAVYEFRNIFVGAQEQTPREDVCASLVYGAGVAQKYFENHFDPRIKAKVEGYTNLIEQITNNHISTSTLNEETKVEAKNKVSSIIECIGYPDWLKNSEVLNKRYLLANITEDIEHMPFMKKLLTTLHYTSDYALGDLRKPFIRNCEWAVSKQGSTFLPYFDGARHTINFPMSFLQPPMFSLDAPDSVNFGALGSTLGHEIAHSLPKIGWTQNQFGNVSEIGKCIVDEYQQFSSSKHKLVDAKKPNGGDATLSENFPDNIGVQMSYWAFKKLKNSNRDPTKYSDGRKEYSEDQLFFLAFAQNFCETSTKEVLRIQTLSDVHSVGKFRVLGSLRNFPEFSRAFSCPLGTYMNPVSKCDIFNETDPMRAKSI